MAGTITHYFFAHDVMKHFDKKDNYYYDEAYLSIFAQNTDPFNFYSIYFPMLIGSANKRKFSEIAHNTNIDLLFNTLITYVKDNKLYNDVQVSSFIYGMITHYVLDSSIHPFVEYKCGEFKKNDKSSYKYNAKHHEMETFLDIYMLNKKGYNNKKYKAYKEVFKIDKFDDNLINLLNYTYKKVYNFNNYSKYYLKSIRDMKLSFRLFRYDPFSVKKCMYYCFDFIMPKYVLNSKFLSYSYIPKNYKYFLNNEKKEWYYPYDDNVHYNLSFDEIYKEAIKKCVDIIRNMHDYMYCDKKFDICKCFNLSYCTGLDWKKPLAKPVFYF